ncbi:MAG: alpha/beta hydrolase [Oscillospiraceae bacterium]|nr:alpha/beta hydrolase [Oscillospiraceae bacterium]
MWALYAVIGAVGLLLLLWLVFGCVVCVKFLSRKAGDVCRDMAKKWAAGEVTDPDSPSERFLVDWALRHKPEEVSIQSRDGLKLVGAMLRQPLPGRPWAVIVHGYTCNKETMAFAVQKYYDEMNMNVLAMDLRAQGVSEGNYITMGWKDRLDVIQWLEWLIEREPGCEITLYGISMGASTVLMVSGEPLPAQVKSIVADCGYTSAEEVFAHNAKEILRLPSWFVLPPANLFAWLLAGFRFKEASALKQVEKNTRPLFLIHGGNDNLVPTKMVYPLRAAAGKTCEQFLVVPGAGHGESQQKDGAYWARVRDFVQAHFHAAPVTA